MKIQRLWRMGLALLLTFSVMSVDAQTFNADVAKPTSAQLTTWNQALNVLFTDNSCSEFNVGYKNYTTAQMLEDPHYQDLPGTLQKMVLKMTTDGTWEEANVNTAKPAWDSEVAKRLRVQMIEPYNDANDGASALRMNAHTNLNNPLGLYANRNQVLYIMVEGELKAGATLYLSTWTGHGKPGTAYNEGTKLQPGLNVVTVSVDGTTGCLNYVVKTFDTAKGYGSKACARKLSDFDDLKVHIEGGILNGFYNKVGDELWGEGDTNEDWDYYAARATHADLTVLGKYITLQFPFKDNLTEGNKGLDYYFTGKNRIEDILAIWDNIMLWERLLMGVASKEQFTEANAKWKSPYSDKDEVFAFIGDNNDEFACDFSEYYNIHGLAFGVGGTAYMYGGWDHCGYHYNTMSSIMGDILTSSGSYWGPGHEIGHQHQAPMTLNGLTEVTNNLFSNVVLWYAGISTSRVNGSEGALALVYEAFRKDGSDFYTNNIWSLTHMYYRLFQYYHLLGHNNEFYPRLYEMLRQNPMNKSYNQDGDVGLLHFYKLACDAAGEDLTEFFRAHGMLEVMNNRFVGDYANSVYSTSQKQIDAAIASVKAKGYKENLAVLFINDGTGEEVIGNKGTALDLYEGFATAHVGNYAHFYAEPTAYTYTIKNKYVNMTGEGGVGFLIRNDKGEIAAFSNKKGFDITDEAAAVLMLGKGKLQVMKGDNTTVDAIGDETTMQYNLLYSLIKKAKAMETLADETGLQVGYYKSDMLNKVRETLAAAQEAYDAATVDQYTTVYQALYDAVAEVEGNKGAMNIIIPGSTYTIKNAENTGRSLSINSTSKVVNCAVNNAKNKLQQWVFERAPQADCYYIKNVKTETYLAALPDGETMTADATTPQIAYKVINMGNGVMALQCQDENLKSLNYGSKGVIGWSHDNTEGSWWHITALELNQTELDRAELDQLIKDTRTLLNEMGKDVLLPGKLPLQVEDESACFYLSSNADQNVVGNATDGGGVAALLDNNTSTYLHTQWNGTAVNAPHHIQVNMVDGKLLSELSISYATRYTADPSSTSPAPSLIDLQGSTDGKTFRSIKKYASSNATNPLPRYTNPGVYWSSPKVITTTPYKVIRLVVTESIGPGNSKYNNRAFFAMSEFALINHKTVVNSLIDEYVGAEEVYIAAADQMFQSSQVSENMAATAEEMSAALANLQAKYDKLLYVFENGLVGIGHITTDSSKAKGIFDLSGRCLDKVTAPGIYIIDGQKKVVR